MKVGFIDYYLDEWHANNYPKMLKELSGGKYEVAYAYAKIDSPKKGGLTSKQWAEKYGVQLLDTIEEVIEKSDRLIVLSPDNPEMHEELCKLPLASGKLVYVDKTFAPDKATAERIFAHAKANNTKCFSSSALRFTTELAEFNKDDIKNIYSEGPGVLEIYSIHQIEPIVCLMQCRAKRVMFTGDKTHPAAVIEFEGGKFAHMYQADWIPFRLTAVNEKNAATVHQIQSEYFPLFLKALIEFFDTGIVPVPAEQTIDVIAIRQAALMAAEKPFTWIDINSL